MTQTIQLTEYSPHHLAADALTEFEAARLWQLHRPHIHVEPPSFQNNNRWVLTPQGWSGHIPVSAKTTLVINPKVPVDNLFAILQTLYNLPSFSFLDGETQTDTISGYLDLLAVELAGRVLARLRQGIHQTYLPKREPIGTVKGRVDPHWIATQASSPLIQCDFTQQTADLPFNQILAYTLRQIALTDLCRPETLRLINRAWRQMPVTIEPFVSQDTAGWAYTRLNEDYRPMHALCRLFLDGLEPTHHHEADGFGMLPFLVNMPVLYEKHVATWLQTNLPNGFALRKQERVRLDASHARHVDIDLVVYDAAQQPVWVLDTKYKAGEPTNDDIYQVTFYAREIGCKSAGLVYPIQPNKPLTGRNQDVSYQSFTFGLDLDPQTAGESFLAQLNLIT